MPLRPLTTLATATAALLGFALLAPASAVAAPGDPAGVARVSAIYSLSVPETRTGLIPAETLAAYTAPTGTLTLDLDSVIDSPVAIGIDPMIIASIRVLGTAAPQTAVDWLDRLAAATNETFPLTYSDSDITLGLQAGSGTVLAPVSFDYAVDATRFAPATQASATKTPAASPTPTAEPTAPPTTDIPSLPTTESLLAWDYTAPGIAWPVAGTVTGADLPAITASGYTMTVLGSSNITRSDEGQARATIADAPVVVSDEGLSALFSSAIDAPTAEEWQAHTLALQSGLAASAAGGGVTGATIVLAADRESLGHATRLGATLDAISALPSVDVGTLAGVLAVPPSEAAIVDLPQTTARVATAQRLLATEASDTAFSTVAANPVLITGERRARLLNTLSTAWNSYPGGWGSAATLYDAESVTLHESVRVVQSSDINLVADRASLPVTVSNSLNQPVTVLVTVSAPTPLLEIEQTAVPITLEPDSQKRGQIPVQSLSNGTAQISISITSAQGVPIGQPTMVRINVFAGWETPFTVFLGVVVVAVFALGIVRVVLRRRRARRESSAESGSASDAPTAQEAAE